MVGGGGGVGGGREYLFQDGECTQRHVLFMWQSAATEIHLGL